MNVATAATLTFNKIPDDGLDRDPNGKTLAHARWMLNGISVGYIQFEKAHRWLGYAQAIIVSHGAATLDELKDINKES